MRFLKVFSCCVETLIILSSLVHGQFLPNPFSNNFNPLSQPGRNGGIMQFVPNPYDSPTNPVNKGPGNFNNFNPLANNPLNQPSNFPSILPKNDDGIIQFVPNPYDQPKKPGDNIPSRGLTNNQPPFNNFNKPPTNPLFQSPGSQPGGFSPFNPNANNPLNRPFNQSPANVNNFKPQQSFPQFPSNPPHQVFGQQPHLSGLPPSSPFHAATNRGPSNHSFPLHAAPIHHIPPAFHPVAKPPSTTPLPPADDDPLLGHRIVCIFNNKHYFRNEFSPTNIDPSLCTHVNYEFAMLDPKSYEMISSEPELDIQMGFYEEAIKLKQTNKRLKVLISLGGWADSTEKYSILANDEDLRKNFVEKAVDFIGKHEFDGMDLAWEYPNCWQGALGVSPKDKGNFVLLLKDLREAFNRKNLVLSISVGAVKKEIKAAYDIPEVSKQVDFINVMTYDMHGPWEPRTGHHTQFDKLPWDKDPYWNSKGALTVWVEGGAPKMKLNLGIALYGKTFTLADPNVNGLNAPITGVGNSNIDSVEGGFILYNTMCQWLNDGNWTEKEDKRAGFYAYSGDQWSCYDPPMMVVRKAKFIVEDGYGGLLFKDLGGDDYLGKCFSMPFPLLKMARFEMLHKVHSKYRHG